jgi:tripartite-type tricarboxylate transporter receptor subunit TctC
MKISRRKFPAVMGTLAFGLGASNSQIVFAQAYPSRPVRLIVPAPPGGALMEILSEGLGAALNQPFILEYLPGASGNIAADVVAHSAPDGHTLLTVYPSHATNGSLYSKLSYDPVKDFAPISLMTIYGTLVLAAHPSVPANNLQEFVAFAKSKGGRMSYGSSGIGQLSHLGMELLKKRAGFEALHVPYKGTAPALQDLLGGHIDFGMVARVSEYVKAGRLKALAVTGTQRSPLLPNVLTVAESGFPGFSVDAWQGLLAPAGTPAAAISVLHREVVRILKLPANQEPMRLEDLRVVASTPQEFDAFLKEERAKWGEVIKMTGAKVD